MNFKVLILCPSFHEKGGVTYYYSLVSKHFNSTAVDIDLYHTGKSGKNCTWLAGAYKTLKDLFLLLKIIPDYDLVFLNPSLDAKAVIRDGIYHLISKRLLNKKTLVLFHGWDPSFEHIISSYGKYVFRFVFNFDKALVLASQFKNCLVRWGFSPSSISLETTVFEQNTLTNNNDIFKLLFLSRFTKDKGGLEAIITASILAHEFPAVKLYMAGDGEQMPELRQYVTQHNLDSIVTFTGWIDNQAKWDLLNMCGIMIFPTKHGEGLPICIIEGMGAGLSIVTRPVGGIPDLMKDGENGFLVETSDPADFACKVKFLFENKKIWNRIMINNRALAVQKCEIRNVVKRLENYLLELLA
ncbi:glycosyltransferase [Pelobacter propionicus]|uniref:Glycosyl transferase, group 1 n=1 Tax=Pelobacter propionicus (strain DSM 2379 / NBRC 103807 / OttBd1) TaxID=338966 RepID=A1ASY7_PELPD|nr:glycosyltransferase [Pelobacter propionicus]ABL00458.1 glycosyl transferase, group 1 [Pelobacter propionicus DSM 2379]